MKLWAGRFQKETDTLVNDINSIIHNADRHIGKILLVGINIVPCRKCSNCLCPPVISIWFAFIMVIILFIYK